MLAEAFAAKKKTRLFAPVKFIFLFYTAKTAASLFEETAVFLIFSFYANCFRGFYFEKITRSLLNIFESTNTPIPVKIRFAATVTPIYWGTISNENIPTML